MDILWVGVLGEYEERAVEWALDVESGGIN